MVLYILMHLVQKGEMLLTIQEALNQILEKSNKKVKYSPVLKKHPAGFYSRCPKNQSFSPRFSSCSTAVRSFFTSFLSEKRRPSSLEVYRMTFR